MPRLDAPPAGHTAAVLGCVLRLYMQEAGCGALIPCTKFEHARLSGVRSSRSRTGHPGLPLMASRLGVTVASMDRHSHRSSPG